MIPTIKELSRLSNDICYRIRHNGHKKLPSVTIMGLILITSILIFILILDALRNQISIHLKYNYKTKQDKKRNKENKQSQTELNTTDDYNPFHITGQPVWNEREPPEYETITENAEKDTLLNTAEQHHQTEQEIKDLQGTVESLQKEIITYYPIIQD